MRPVVDQAWIEQRQVVLADVRWYLDGRSGRAAYDEGHLPGAVFVDVDRRLAGDPSPEAGRHPLPDPEAFAEGMTALGIGDQDLVVAYDDAGGVNAARLVWMLRATGHDAALLDGGLQAFRGELERVERPRAPAVFSARPWPPEWLAGSDDAVDPGNVVIDARARERYRGEHEPVDPRPGHIPGAVSLPAGENLGADGRFLPVETLRRRFIEAGVTGDASVVTYCGSGVTSCHTLLAMEHAGLGSGRLYPGSWSQYSHDPGRTVAVGDEPADPPR